MANLLQDIEDALEAVISESLEPEWTPRSAARHIISQLDDIGLAPTGFTGGTEPDASGSFQGDLWYGDPLNRTLPTHQWDALNWRRLSERERRSVVAA